MQETSVLTAAGLVKALRSGMRVWVGEGINQDLASGQPRQYALSWAKAFCLGGNNGSTPC